MRTPGKPKEIEERRERAMRLVGQGYGTMETARIMGVSRESIRFWRKLFKENGKEGLKVTPPDGRPPKINEKERELLREGLIKGAKACGFSTDLWTLSRVAKHIKEEFGVEYHPGHVWRILRKMGFSAQKPQRRAKERDEGVIQNWIDETWPKIKKKRVN